MQVKVYVMHSGKIDYKNNLYRPLLQTDIMKSFFLVLPRSEKYFSCYVKDLIDNSDIIICDLSNINFSLKLEIKWANKFKKKMFYMCNKNYKLKLKLDNVNYYSNECEMVNMVSNYLNSLNKKQLLLERDNIYCLGNINREK